jgi:hypothetical protein
VPHAAILISSLLHKTRSHRLSSLRTALVQNRSFKVALYNIWESQTAHITCARCSQVHAKLREEVSSRLRRHFFSSIFGVHRYTRSKSWLQQRKRKVAKQSLASLSIGRPMCLPPKVSFSIRMMCLEETTLCHHCSLLNGMKQLNDTHHLVVVFLKMTLFCKP